MGNESGKWIMHGMKWDNLECMHEMYPDATDKQIRKILK